MGQFSPDLSGRALEHAGPVPDLREEVMGTSAVGGGDVLEGRLGRSHDQHGGAEAVAQSPEPIDHGVEHLHGDGLGLVDDDD